jgi:ABC-type dipeptide/oligopeptide/nickel transport system permease subunit
MSSAIAVLAFNFVGDGMRDAADPYARQPTIAFLDLA